MENEQIEMDVLTEQQIVAKSTLHRNAALASRYAKNNRGLLVVVFALLVYLVHDKFYEKDLRHDLAAAVTSIKGLEENAKSHNARKFENGKLKETNAILRGITTSFADRHFYVSVSDVRYFVFSLGMVPSPVTFPSSSHAKLKRAMCAPLNGSCS